MKKYRFQFESQAHNKNTPPSWFIFGRLSPEFGFGLLYGVIQFYRLFMMNKGKKKTSTQIICENLGLPNQTIFQDYKCIFRVNFPFFGRLYIGQEHLMFVSNMFGIVKKAAIEIDAISKVELLEDGTITILGKDVKAQKKEEEEYLFSGFKNSNPYKIIYALWKKETLSSEVLTSQNQEELEPGEKLAEMKLLDEANVEVSFFNPEIVDTQKQKIIEIVLPCSLDQFYSFFVSEDAIYSRKKHLQGKKSTNVLCTPWKPNEEMKAEMREITATLKVKGVPFRSEAGMTQIWLITKRNEQEMTIKVITQMADLPYSSNFTCEEHMVIEKHTDNKCRFSCSIAIVFNKATMMKNTILTRTFADYKEDYILWSQNVKELLDNMRKNHEQNDKKKSRAPINVEFQELKMLSPSKSSRGHNYYENEEEIGIFIEKRMVTLNRKINLLIALVLILLVSIIYLLIIGGPPRQVNQHQNL